MRYRKSRGKPGMEIPCTSGRTTLDVADVQRRVLESRAAAKFSATDNPDFPRADLERALQIDRFQFAMKVERVDNLLVLRSTA